jgi:hypothetical protein
MRQRTRPDSITAAVIGALLLCLCGFAAIPAAGQTIPRQFDPDATDERLRGVSSQLDRKAGEAVSRTLAERRVDSPVRLKPGKLEPGTGFLKGHLLPRMSHQIGDVSSIHALESQRGIFGDSGMHAWVSDAVEHRAVRATRKAAKAYLYEETSVGSWFDTRRIGGGSGPVARRATDFRFGVSHGVPKIGLRHRAAVGVTRFQVGLDGSVRLEFRPSQSTTARFYAGYDARVSGYQLFYRLGF